jgi:hypothetical protein
VKSPLGLHRLRFQLGFVSANLQPRIILAPVAGINGFAPLDERAFTSRHPSASSNQYSANRDKRTEEVDKDTEYSDTDRATEKEKDAIMAGTSPNQINESHHNPTSNSINHTRSLTCAQCNSSFNRLAHLKRHQKTRKSSSAPLWSLCRNIQPQIG